MPTPTLTCACEYVSGTIRTASKAAYLRYRILLPPASSSTILVWKRYSFELGSGKKVAKFRVVDFSHLS
jgi:hypothetical protein